MDILSSQANLAGYKAVVEAFQVYERAIHDDDCSWNNSCSKSISSWSRCGWISIATAKEMELSYLQQMSEWHQKNKLKV